ncbi:MAG TPA: lipid-A-disaccharide synthase [bacterium]|nr:lipid-A-disaccharide synthase [bacterium]
MAHDDLIMVVAGEASADAHAAALVTELGKLRPGLEVYGVGGAALKALGADLILDLSRAGVVGISEALPELKRFYGAYRSLVRSIKERAPRGVVLLDLPEFNLLLARKIRKVRPETRIIYYISPQVWAWRPGRVRKIAARVDAMLTLFPFEVEFYKERAPGFDVEFVGHPVRDSARPSSSAGELRRGFGVDSAAPVIALLPGSRRAEVETYLPVMAKVVERAKASRKGAGFLLAQAPTLDQELIRRNLGNAGDVVRIISGRACDVLAASDLALVASGTATLEAAVVGTPMIVLGAVSWLTYAIVKPMALVPNYSLPNVVAGRAIVPELIQREMNPERLGRAMDELLDHPEQRDRMRSELGKVRDALGGSGASRRAAEAVYRRLWGTET